LFIKEFHYPSPAAKTAQSPAMSALASSAKQAYLRTIFFCQQRQRLPTAFDWRKQPWQIERKQRRKQQQQTLNRAPPHFLWLNRRKGEITAIYIAKRRIAVNQQMQTNPERIRK
jgi:hypothetical protein